jgi:hypothetical protein
MSESNDLSLCLSEPTISEHKLDPQTDCCKDSLTPGMAFGLFACFSGLEQVSDPVVGLLMSRYDLFAAAVESFGFAWY